MNIIEKIYIYIDDNPYTSLILTLFLLFFYQLFNIIWGLELVDTGFHLVAFENVFEAPQSIISNFPYYFTNILGGMFLRLFPFLGVVGFRIIGSLFVLASIIFIYVGLKDIIKPHNILIGESLVVITYLLLPYSLNNAICSCFFYVCSILLLYKGLTKEKGLYVFLGGMIVGINIFTRVPNILGLGLVFVILFKNWIRESKKELDIRNSLIFLLGILGGVCCIFALMHRLGHVPVFLQSMKILFMNGASSDDCHSVFNLIMAQLAYYIMVAKDLFAFVGIIYIGENLIRRNELRLTYFIVTSLLAFLFIYFNRIVFIPLWALCIAGCIWSFFKQRKELGLLSIFALYMLFIETMGSDNGCNHGSLPLLVASPIAVSLIYNKRYYYVAVLCVASIMLLFIKGNYADGGCLIDKRYTLNSKELFLVRTTYTRSNAINESLAAIMKYVSKGDTLMVYPSAPLMNFLTHTRPAAGDSWPGLARKFVRPIEVCPILIQKFNYSTDWNVAVRELPLEDASIPQELLRHLEINDYRKVFENQYFILLFPKSRL